jgi:hydroxymethylglutaryl-CoA reductase
MTTKNSAISGFYKKNIEERQHILKEWANLSESELATLTQNLSAENASNMIENAIGIFSLPYGLATNFLVNNINYLIPLVIEEPSVVAALSNAGKLIREGGGFNTHSDEPLMIGQIQVLDMPDLNQAEQAILENQALILEKANEIGGSIVKRGGGAKGLACRSFPDTRVGPMLVIHLIIDVRDAMGANAVNTAAEHTAPLIEELTGGRVNLRILTNLTDERKAYAVGIIPASSLASSTISGHEAVQRIVEATTLAEVDPYRAATHNKGIMNGIDAFVIATGNDWRAIEAGAHAYAARDGQYRSLTKWEITADGDLKGSIEIPMALGVVGGATKVHQMAQLSLKVLGNPNARTLAEIAACVGLAQNFAAIRALAIEGIQRGHMRMHAKQLAVAAGAVGAEVASVVNTLTRSNNIRLETAKQILEELRQKDKHI